LVMAKHLRPTIRTRLSTILNKLPVRTGSLLIGVAVEASEIG
jgi:hypothetical protein